MPLIKLQTSMAVPPENAEKLVAAMSKLTANAIGKPEQYVMATVTSGPVSMSGQPGDAAFADVRSIGGLTPKVNKQIAEKLCALLKDSLGIPPDRVYINFTDVPAANWGWNGSTFG